MTWLILYAQQNQMNMKQNSNLQWFKQILHMNNRIMHMSPTFNVAFQDRLGKTLLSHAIDVNNLDLVTLLIENGAHVGQIRVRENEEVTT